MNRNRKPSHGNALRVTVVVSSLKGNTVVLEEVSASLEDRSAAMKPSQIRTAPWGLNAHDKYEGYYGWKKSVLGKIPPAWRRASVEGMEPIVICPEERRNLFREIAGDE